MTNTFEVASVEDIDEIVTDAINLPFLCVDNETILNRTGYYSVIDNGKGDSIAIDISKGTNDTTKKPNFAIHVDAMGGFEDDTRDTWFTTKGNSKKELTNMIRKIIFSYVIWECME